MGAFANVTASLSYANSNANIGILQKLLAVSNLSISVSGKNYVEGTMAVPTTAGGTVIPLGSLTGLGWGIFWNHDGTNYVDILPATSGVSIVRMLPGEPAVFRFGSGITAPAALAHTAVVLMEYLIIEP